MAALLKGRMMAFRPAVGQPALLPPPARSSVVVRSTGWADSKATNAEKAMFGENFGARDPFAAEIESNFSEKVLGNYNTDHIIKIPSIMKSHIGLTARSCSPASELALMEEKERDLLKQQVPGWKVISNAEGKQAIRQDWRLRSVEAAAKLQGMLTELAAKEGHPAGSVTVSGDMVIAELTTASLGGLTMNDFILAAKINELDLKELLPPPRKRFWA